MSNFSQLVFTISLILSLIIVSLTSLLLRGTKGQKWMLPYCAIAVLVHLLWWAWPTLPLAAQELTRWAFAIWLGFVLVATALFPVFALAKIIARVRGKAFGRHIDTIYAGICVLSAIALCVGGASPRIREEVILIANLDPRLDGFRIANLGDAHVDRFVSPADLEKMVRVVASRNVQVLAITGDLIDDFRLMGRTLDAIDDPRIANIIAIIGNHEKVGKLAAVIKAYESRKDRISLLVDGNVAVEHAGSRVHFVGIDYAMESDGGHMLAEPLQKRIMARQAASAFPKARKGELVVALSHHPEFFPIAASQGAQLTLSSHTHGGQVAVFGRPLINAYDYISGRYEAYRRHLDVSAGFGHWLPLRLGVPREVVILTLKRNLR